ncbi:DUF3545 family protein [Vibrio marisflavi]|uniref:DUF3545 domain-containing protein n=1 Tax=Vibrio marisflavi CECT 7928 TaxID=634439 RepID=A0ABN8E6D8_9VIBR|nr:DUF3545 family protein [Vibrio marisflavi]CAH0541250.1 hypothetical protein VMF7928_03469 [Vibrio marisflavi CECT 7928]
MDGSQFDDMVDMDLPKARSTRSKPAKRKWREIEAIKDKQKLQRELMEMDIGLDIDDIEV